MTMPELTIRAAVENDAASVALLSAELGYPASTEETKGRLTPLLASDRNAVFVAQSSDGLVVGWIHVFVARRVESGPFAELGGFVVRDGYRGRGIGRRMLAAAEAWALAQGVGKLRVRTRTTRKAAPAFYRRLGFASSKEQTVFDKRIAEHDPE